MEQNKERRKQQRFPCSGLIEMVGIAGESRNNVLRTGLIENVSESGACVQVDGAVPVGTELLLRDQLRTVEIRAVVRNVRRGDVGYFIGVEFTGELQSRPPLTRLMSPAVPLRSSTATRDSLTERPHKSDPPSSSENRPPEVRTLALFTKLVRQIRNVRNKIGIPVAEMTASGIADTQIPEDPLGFFDDIPAAAIVLDAEFRVTYTNTAFIRLVGSTSLTSSRAFEQFVCPEDAERVIDCARSAVSEPGAVRSVSFRLQAPQGDLLEVDSWWRYSAASARTVVQILDVSADKRHERKLLGLVRGIEHPDEEVGLAAWTLNLRSGTLECSRELASLFNLDARTVKLDRTTWTSLIHPDDQPRIHAALIEAVSRGEFHAWFRANQRVRREARFAASGHVVFDESGQPSRIVGRTLRTPPRHATAVTTASSQV